MKILTQILLVMLFISPVALSQEKNNDSLSAKAPHYLNLQQDIELSTPDFNFYRSLYFENLPASADSNSIWLWTSLALSNNNNGSYLFSRTEPHMLANLHDQYFENSKFSMVKTVLGMAQLGAVGYLAYKSIQKHGFWDNK